MNLINEDDDLIYFDGMAIQKDKTKSINYGLDYFYKYVSYEGTSIAIALNKSRVKLTEKYCNVILDTGIGSGEFIKYSRIKVYGFDINPVGIEWLKSKGIYCDPYKDITEDVEGWTFWDSLEHMPEPMMILSCIPCGHYVFISMPIFSNILEIKKSKHYRPNEHFLYFTNFGLINYMCNLGFRFLESNDEEIKAGRQDIIAFVFLRQSCSI